MSWRFDQDRAAIAADMKAILDAQKDIEQNGYTIISKPCIEHRYAVVTCGVRNQSDYREAVLDTQVAEHYRINNVTFHERETWTAPASERMFVSARYHGQIGWLNYKLRIPAGETLFLVNAARRIYMRQGCGNLAMITPPAPAGYLKEQPPPGEMTPDVPITPPDVDIPNLFAWNPVLPVLPLQSEVPPDVMRGVPPVAGAPPVGSGGGGFYPATLWPIGWGAAGFWIPSGKKGQKPVPIVTPEPQTGWLFAIGIISIASWLMYRKGYRFGRQGSRTVL